MPQPEHSGISSLFAAKLAAALATGLSSFHANNIDTWRFPSSPWATARRVVIEHLVALAHRLGFVRNANAASIEDGMGFIIRNLGPLARVHDLLADEHSKDLLVALLALRVLGPRRVPLPMDRPLFWDARRAVRRHRVARRTRLVAGWPLDRYRISGTRQVLELDCHASNILQTFLLHQYAYSRGTIRVAAEDTDVVIDGGGCWGDTALDFAARVGPGGHVYAFEFDDTNIAVLSANLNLNPTIKDRVTIVPHALSGERATGSYRPTGPSSRLDLTAGTSPDARPVTIDTLDAFVAARSIPRINLVKLDIEGAERQALDGATQALRRWRPKLAISVYHRPQDVFEIPLQVSAILPDYDFYLDHFTNHSEETVLFGAPRIPPTPPYSGPLRVGRCAVHVEH